MSDGFGKFSGFGVGTVKKFTIPSGGNGEAVIPIDLLRPFAFLVIACPNTSNFANAANTLSVLLSYDTDSPMYFLNDTDGIKVAQAVGSDGTFWRLFFVGAARRVQIRISANVTDDTEFLIVGVDAGAA